MRKHFIRKVCYVLLLLNPGIIRGNHTSTNVSSAHPDGEVFHDIPKIATNVWQESKPTLNKTSNQTVNNSSSDLGISPKNNAKFRRPNLEVEKLPFFYKIHSTLTRSKDAVWATITLSFICIVLLIAVAHSRMWRDHREIETQGIPLPNFNERVPFKEVMEHKMALLKELFSKRKKKKIEQTELESLLVESGSDY